MLKKKETKILLNFYIILIFIINYIPDNFANSIYARFPDIINTDMSAESGKIGLNPYGFIFTDLFWDSRQVLAFRDDEVLFWPLKFKPDRLCADINAHAKFNFVSTRTLVGVKFSPIDISQNTRLSARIEADFLGNTDLTTLHFRLRHAYILFEFENLKSDLLIGQYWHPFFVIDCYPHTLTYNFGAPFNTESRPPQVRYSQNIKSFEFVFTAATQQVDFVSNGPNGFSSVYLRNSAIPNLDFQARYYTENNMIGVGFDYKRLVPRLKTNKCFKAHEHIDSFMATAYSQLIHGNFAFRVKYTYSQNGTDLTMISGYAIRTVDPITDHRTYENTRSYSIWVDTSYFFESNKIELGIFGAHMKNLGSNRSLFINSRTNQPTVYNLDPKIHSATRISPRFLIKREPLIFGIEIEFTRASFGCLNRFAQVIDPKPVNNIRFTTGIYYVF